MTTNKCRMGGTCPCSHHIELHSGSLGIDFVIRWDRIYSIEPCGRICSLLCYLRAVGSHSPGTNSSTEASALVKGNGRSTPKVKLMSECGRKPDYPKTHMWSCAWIMRQIFNPEPGRKLLVYLSRKRTCCRHFIIVKLVVSVQSWKKTSQHGVTWGSNASYLHPEV